MTAQDTWRVFRAPALLALLSATGLLTALFGDRAWDALSCAALGGPLAVIVWHWLKPNGSRRSISGP